MHKIHGLASTGSALLWSAMGGRSGPAGSARGDWAALDPNDADDADELAAGFGFAATVAAPRVSASQYPSDIQVGRATLGAGQSAGGLDVETRDGALRLFAVNRPTGDIALSTVLLGTKTWPEPKSPCRATPSSTAVSVAAGASASVTVTRDGDGLISATSGDPAVASASASGDTVTITGVAAGTTLVRIDVAEGTAHTAATASVGVTVT